LDRTPRRQKRIILATIGAALAVPLIAVPASASLDGGGFFIHAQNIEESKFKATAGLKGTNPGGGGGSGGGTTPGDGTGGGGTTPGGGTGGDGAVPGSPEDSSKVLASYQRGPVDFKITQAMIDFSKANEALVAEGKAPRTSPDGWQSIAYFDGAAMRTGFPDDGSKPLVTVLAKSMATPVLSFGLTDAIQAQVVDDPSYFSYIDLRSPESGKLLGYSYSPSYDPINEPDRYFYGETRWISEEGDLRAITVARQSDGRTTVDRLGGPLLNEPVSSDTKPYRLSLNKEGSGFIFELNLKTPRYGANNIYLNMPGDGSGQFMYRNYTGMTSDGQMGLGSFESTGQGPTRLMWDSEGRFVQLSDENGFSLYNGVFTASDWNELTGKSWDGSYLKASDFDLKPPFTPVAP